MKRRYKILIALLILAGFTVASFGLFIDPILNAAGEFLVISDEPKKSDIVFVPSGNPRVRFVKAIELLKAGLADGIVINLERPNAGDREFERRYGKRFSTEAFVEHIMNVEGVSPVRVIIPDQRPVSTREDFELLKRIMEEKGFQSVIITSSWFHLRRCRLVAKRLLKEDAEICLVPANLPDMNYFTSRPKRILGIFNAYLKLGYYYIAAL
jgi:uncharacterized SAM-binding protein YcdF (DUF218 family)